MNNPLRLIDSLGMCGSDKAHAAGEDDDDDDRSGTQGDDDDSSGGCDPLAGNCDVNPPAPDGYETCITEALEQVIRNGDGTVGDAGYGTLTYGTVISAPQFPNLVGQTGSAANPIYLDPNTLSGFPNILVHVGGTLYSHAWGAYQILPGTWTQYLGSNYTDVSAGSQDFAAGLMLSSLGATDAAMQGNLQQAMWDANTTWASLPDLPYGQPTMTMDQATSIFNTALGTLPDCTNPPTPGTDALTGAGDGSQDTELIDWQPSKLPASTSTYSTPSPGHQTSGQRR